VSAEPSVPGPLAQRALALQRQFNEVNELTTRALGLVAQSPAEAEPLLAEALDRNEALHEAQEADLHAQIEAMREGARDTRAMLLMARGQAAVLLGDLALARSCFEVSLQVIGDRPNPLKPMLRLAMANLGESEAMHGYERQ
jgi:hypothetical protein